MLKSVRVYFNTKRMSAILKALQNRTVNVELKSEVVELALDLGGIKAISSKLQANIKAYNNKFKALDNMVGDLRGEAKDLDGRFDKFYKEVQEIEKEGKKLASDLGVKFIDTPIGKEVDKINRSILVGDLEAVKQGLKISI